MPTKRVMRRLQNVILILVAFTQFANPMLSVASAHPPDISFIEDFFAVQQSEPETPTPEPLPPADPPGIPAPAAPTGEITVQNPTFAWTGVDGADHYRLVVDGDAGNVLNTWYEPAEVCQELACKVSPELSLLEGEYSWYVQAAIGTVEGGLSNPLAFTVELGPGAAVLTAPEGAIDTASPTFSWQSVAGATDYHIEVLGPGDVVVLNGWHAESEVCVETTCSFTPSDFVLDDATYFWRVQTRNDLAEGAQSALMSFSVGAPLPQLRVIVDAAPKSVSAGDTVTVTVTILNEGTAEAQNVAFHNVLPEAFSFMSSPGSAVEADSESGALTAEIGTLAAGQSVTLTYQIQATTDAVAGGEAISDVVEVSADGVELPALAEFTLLVLDPALQWDPLDSDAASAVETPRVEVEIPASAYSGIDSVLVVKPIEENEGSPEALGALTQFEIVALVDTSFIEPALAEEAQRAALEESEVPLSEALDKSEALTERDVQFDRPVAMTISFEGLVDLSALPDDRTPFVAYWDEEAQAWLRQPVETINLALNSVTIETTHFSTWGAGVAGSFPTNGTSVPIYDEARVSLFSGKASYSYPLWVPNGRAGMAPSIALSYSSATADGILSNIQSPWVGHGWNIDAIEITRLITTTQVDGMGTVYGYQNDFLLTFNGTGYKLVEDPYHLGRYHTEDEAFLYIQRHNIPLGNEKDGTVSPPNQSQEWWEVVTASGTRYRIGWDENAEQIARMEGTNNGYQDSKVFDLGPDNMWDDDGVTAPSVMQMADGSYRMWYTGIDGNSQRIGLTGGVNSSVWTRLVPFDARHYEAENGTVTSPMSIEADDEASSCNYVMATSSSGQIDIPIVASASGATSIWIHTIDPNYTFSILDYNNITPQNPDPVVVTSGTWQASTSNHFEWLKFISTASLTINTSYTLRFVPLGSGNKKLDSVYVTTGNETPMPRYCGSAVVLDKGASTTWNDDKVLDPEVIKVGNTYHMWFAGANGGTYKIGHATSPDGEHWAMDTSNPVLNVGTSGTWDKESVRQPTVVYDSSDSAAPFKMWYSGKNGSNEWQIGYATSLDGTTWAKSSSNPVKKNNGTWKKTIPLEPEVIWDGDEYVLWFVEHNSSSDKDELWVGTSTDPLDWTVVGSTPIFTSSGWRNDNLEGPSALFDGTTYRLWFGAATNQRIGQAYATGDPATPSNWTLPGDTSGEMYHKYAGEGSNLVAQRWRVDRVTDVHGNTIVYDYDEETRTHSGRTYERASYLKTIRYTGWDDPASSTDNPACDPAEDDACYEVVFITASREANQNDPLDMPKDDDLNAADTWDSKYLDKVEIHALSGEDDTILRTYDLAYHEVKESHTPNNEVEKKWDSLVLDEIVTQAGAGGSSALTAPKMSFSYTDLPNRSSNVNNRAQWEYPRLWIIDNGTGGKVKLTYQHVSSGDETHYWRILSREGTDGVTGDIASNGTVTGDRRSVVYSYDQRCHYKKGSGWCNAGNNGDLIGYGLVTETLKDFDGTTTLSQTLHYFERNQQLSGREYKTETKDSQGNVHFETVNSFASFNRNNQSSYPEGVKFVYTSATVQSERQNGVLVPLTKTTYAYDPIWGDMTQQELFTWDETLSTPAWALETTTVNDFIENVAYPTTFLHSFGRSSITYAGNTSGTVIAASYSAYDGTAASLGTKGQLTLSQSKTLLHSVAPNETLDTSYTYDPYYGNVTVTRQHGQYGTLGTLPTNSSTLDRVSETEYDTTFHAFPVASTNPLGHESSVQYDFQLSGELPLGLARKTTDPNGAITETKYDALGRTTEVWQAGASQANIKTIFPTVNGSNQIAAPYTIQLQIWDDTRTDEDCSGTASDGAKYRCAYAFYDGYGRILRTIGPAEDTNKYIVSDTHFDARGQVDKAARPYETTITTPPGTWSAPNWSTTPHTLTTFDDLGRAVQVTAPGNIISKTQYDGRKTISIDPNGHKKESITDDLGQVEEVWEWEGDWSGTPPSPTPPHTVTEYDYDVRGLLVDITDDANNVITLGYDGLGQKVSMDDPDMGEWEYSYDLWGQLYTQIDGRDEKLQFEYDKLGRVTERSIWDGSSWQTVATFTYDDTTSGNKGIGRQTGMVSYYNGQTLASDALVYNLLGQLTSTTRQVDVDEDGTYDYTFTTTSTFDSLGRVLTQTLPNPDLGGTTPNLSAETLTFSYNARGLFESIETDVYSGYQYVELTDYTATGGIEQQRMGNDVLFDPTYNTTTNRMTALYVGKAPGELLDFTYTYDNAGNIKTIVDDIDGVREERHEFTYDHLNRLTAADICTGTITSACSAGGQTLTEQRDYSYNAIGNITAYTYNNGSALTYTYSGVIAGPHAATGYNGWIYTYDANGNMLTRSNGSQSWTHTIDEENRLATVSDGTTTTRYLYDGNGTRLMRRVGATATVYVLGMEVDLTVTPGNPPSHSWNKSTLYYPQGGAFRVVESGDAAYTNTELFYRHNDHLGSTSVISNTSGTKVTGSDTTYAPFGEMRGGTSLSTLTDFGYTGQTLDRDTGGLMYYVARYYLPGLRRFISPDTMIPGQDNPQNLNRFSYALNNPILYNDPTGHFINIALAAAGGIIGAVVGAAIVAGPQMIKNHQQGQPLTANIDPREVAKGALIGAGVGVLAGATLGIGLAVAGAAAGGSAAAAETATGVGGAAFTADRACGGDMCVSEVQDTTRAVTSAAQAISQATGGDPSDEIEKAGNIINGINIAAKPGQPNPHWMRPDKFSGWGQVTGQVINTVDEGIEAAKPIIREVFQVGTPTPLNKYTSYVNGPYNGVWLELQVGANSVLNSALFWADEALTQRLIN